MPICAPPYKQKVKTDSELTESLLMWIEENDLTRISLWFELRRIYKVYLRNFQDCIEGNVQRCLVVSNVYIQPKFRKLGVYAKMLLQLEEVAKQSGLAYIEIENVWEHEHFPIYLSRGYKPMGRTPECFYKSLVQQDQPTKETA